MRKLFKRIWNQNTGTVLSSELLAMATVLVVGLLVAFTAARDAVVSEVSDIAGSVQDLNISYSVNGSTGASSSVAGMDFNDALDAGDSTDEPSGQADNFIRFDLLPINEGTSYVSPSFGHPTTAPFSNLDSWRSNLIIDEDQTFANSLSDPVSIIATDFSFYAGRTGGVVTPFIVKVNGDNDFEVVAVGDTAAVSSVGNQTHSFSNAPTIFDVGAGETLAFGFMDAQSDGTGGNLSVIRFQYSSNEIWYSGGPAQSHSGSVTVGSAPVPGRRTLTTQNRDYQFEIGIRVPQ